MVEAPEVDEFPTAREIFRLYALRCRRELFSVVASALPNRYRYVTRHVRLSAFIHSVHSEIAGPNLSKAQTTLMTHSHGVMMLAPNIPAVAAH